MPADDSDYGAFINISGGIIDPYKDTEYGGIEKLDYTISSLEDFNMEPLTGSIELEAENYFDIMLPAIELTGKQQVVLSAVGENSNSSEALVKIKEGESDLTTFIFETDAGSLIADWRPVSIVDSYTLYLTNAEEEPSADNSQVFKNAEPPVVARNLEYGTLYKARLTADSEYGLLNSSVIDAIPVGARTFNLNAEGEFKQIRLNWTEIPAADVYTVYRSVRTPDNFQPMRNIEFSTNYIDRDVMFAADYYYYITPTGHEKSVSSTVTASIKSAPEDKLTELNQISEFSPVDIDVFGSYAYTAAGDDGFRIVDLTDPESLDAVSALTTFSASSVKVRGDYAYLVGGTDGLNIVNIVDPESPFVVGTRGTQNAHDLVLKDDYAVIADGEGGIRIIDVSDSKSPSRAGSLTGINSTVLGLSSSYLYSSTGDAVVIYDISSVSNIEKISVIDVGDVSDIVIEKDTCYILSKKNGLNIYDVTDIRKPEKISEYDLRDPESIVIQDAFAYIADGRGGLKVINISFPRKPTLFESHKTEKSTSVDIYGENVIIAETGGLTAVQAFLRGVSFLINSLRLDGKAFNLSVFRNLAFISQKSSGLKILDISRPEIPEDTGLSANIEYAGISAVSGNDLYLAADDTLLRLFS